MDNPPPEPNTDSIDKQTDFSKTNVEALELVNKCLKKGYALRIDDLTITEYPKEKVVSLKPSEAIIESARKEAVGASATPKLAKPPVNKQVANPISESVCQACGGDNPVWYAPNELWNRVVQDEVHFLCPNCFIRLAEGMGIKPTAWNLQGGNLDSVSGTESSPPDKADDPVNDLAKCDCGYAKCVTNPPNNELNIPVQGGQDEL